MINQKDIIIINEFFEITGVIIIKKGNVTRGVI